MKSDSIVNYPGKKTFYIYLLILISVPLMPTPYTGNPFYFTKNSLIMICGGIFIISSAVLIFKNSKNRGPKSFDLIFDTGFDPGIILFFIAIIISTIFSINVEVSYYGTYLRPLGFEILFYIFLLYFFTTPYLTDRNKRLIILYTMEITACLVAFYAVLQYLDLDPFGFQWAATYRPISTIGNGVFLAGFLLLAFPFTLYRIIKRRKINITILSPVLLIYVIIISQTRTAYVALFAEIVIILFLYPFINKQVHKPILQKLKYSILITGGIIILLILLILVFPHNVFVLRFLNVTDFNNARLLLWRDSLSICKKYPFTGCGINTFPLAFEDVYTMQFKIKDVGGNYDSAHSNFLHTLCTVGIIGLVAYIYLIGRSMYIVLKSIFSNSLKSGQKLFYLSAFSMLMGYIIYGTADFDDISIMLYLFAYLCIIKSVYTEDFKLNVFRPFAKLNKIIPQGNKIIMFMLSIFLCYNIYISFVRLEADKYFGIAYSFETNNQFQPSLDYYTSANNLWKNNSYFMYRYGCTLFDYALYGNNLNPGTKKILLDKSKSELLDAVKTYPFKKDCLLLVSLINYELGDTIEGNKIKNDLLERDSLFVSFRVALAQYYLYKKDFEKLLEQTIFVCTYDPANEQLNNIISMLLYDKANPYPKLFAEKILKADPTNEIAIRYLKINH